jgi:adenylate kinase
MNEQLKTITDWLGSGAIDIFGRPFSGKDTQGKLLADLLGGVLIGGGDILRSHHDPKQIEEILANGGIVPSDFYINLVLPYLSRPQLSDKPLLLSAVGRSHGEEPIIMKAAVDSDHPIKAVVSLSISEDEVWRRFEQSKVDHDRGNRSDDRSEVLKTRLTKFHDNTLPVLDYYRDKNLLIEVDGTLSREQVTNEILAGLTKFSSD